MADPTPVADAAAGHGGGLPQFDLSQWPGQIVWLLLIFAVLYFLFQRVFVPNIGETIAKREDKIAGDIAAARRLKEEAEAQAKAAAAEMTVARERAQKLAADAKAEAKSNAARQRAEEAGRLAKGIADAEARIAAARDGAKQHVRSIAAETAVAMISRLTGAPASVGEIDAALAREGHLGLATRSAPAGQA
jgi:F-type H+-transporting ATPase subunit b